LNGSFASLFKTKKITDVSVDPVVFQLYTSFGVFLSSFALLPFLKDDITTLITLWGILAGCLSVLALYASFAAVDHIGVALAQGIWGGVAIVVSWLWGVLIFRDLPSSLWMSILSLLILIVGGFVIAFCDKIGKYMQPSNSSAESEPLLDTSMNHVDEVDSMSKVFRGVSLSIIVGLTGGSILVPLHYVSESKQGILFLPSFGIGSLLTSPIIYCIHSIFSRSMPVLHFRESIWTGLLSGFLYNLGNFLSILAIPVIGYNVAYPILQCAILVSGVWGIYVFKEITNPRMIYTFWIGGFILLVGAILLTIAQ